MKLKCINKLGFNEFAKFKVVDDTVTQPSHYMTHGGIETIDYIKSLLTKDEFRGYCVGNIIKYVSRHFKKNGVEDLQKAEVYLKWLIESEVKG